MRPGPARGGLALLALGLGLLPGAARASDGSWAPGERTTSELPGEASARDVPGTSDGVYGRFDGDLFLGLGAGADLGGGTRGALLGRALFYQTLGLFGGYTDAFGDDAPLRRTLSAEGELRPLFLFRWSLDLENDAPILDLSLDSLSLGAGVTFADLGDGLGKSPVLDLSVGIAIPLQANANGFWLEGRATYRPRLTERTAVTVLLGFSHSLLSPLVD